MHIDWIVVESVEDIVTHAQTLEEVSSISYEKDPVERLVGFAFQHEGGEVTKIGMSLMDLMRDPQKKVFSDDSVQEFIVSRLYKG